MDPVFLLPDLGGAGSFWCLSKTPWSWPISLFHSHWWGVYHGYLSYNLVNCPGRKSGWTLVEHPPRSSARRNHSLNILEQIIHHPWVFHEDGNSLPGGDWISGSHQLVVHPGFVDNLGWLSDQLPDASENHCLLRVVLPNFFTLLAQHLSHNCHLCVEVGVLPPNLFELPLFLVKLFPVRHLGQLSEDVSGSAIVQRRVGSSGDVLQPVVVGLEICKVIVHPLERVFRKLPRG